MERKHLKIFVWQGANKGGAEQVMESLSNNFRQIESVALTRGFFSGEDIGKEDNTVCVKRILPRKLVAYNTIWAAFSLVKKLKEYDLIITHTAGGWFLSGVDVAYHEPGDLWRMMKSLRFRSKLLYLLPYLMAKIELKKALVPVAASISSKRFMESINVEPGFVTTNGVDLENIPLRLQNFCMSHEKQKEFVFVGRNDYIKNFKILRKVFLSLPEGFRLNVFGFGGVGRNICFYGWKKKKEVHDFVAKKAFAVIVSSHFEAFPLIVLESLCIGVPVIISKFAAPEELKDFCLVYDGTEEGLTQAVHEMNNSYSFWCSKALSNVESVRKLFDSKKIYQQESKKILDVYFQKREGKTSSIPLNT